MTYPTPISAFTPTTPSAEPLSSGITLAEADALHAYAKSRGLHGNVQIILAAAAVIDALNGVPDFWRQLPELEDELFELIEARRDSPCWYAAMRAGVVS